MRLRRWFFVTITALLIFTGFCFPANANDNETVLGFGVGQPYGGIGVNLEIGFNDYIVPTAGLGLLPDNLGWNVGARLYFPGRDHKFRGRLTALYGTNTVLEKNSYSGTKYETREGFSGGVGFNWRLHPSWAIDMDLFLLDTDTPDGYEKQGGDVKISVGVSYRW